MNLSYPTPPEGYGAFDQGQDEIQFPRRINTEKIDNIEFDDIDYIDYPDFVDAYICCADMNGITMTEEELEDLNQNYGDFVHEMLLEYLF